MSLWQDRFGQFTHTWLGLTYAVFILLALLDARSLLGRALCAAPLIWLGKVSFATYMFHQAVAGLLHGLLLGQSPQIRSQLDALVTVASLLVTLALAAISYRYFEAPLLRMGHRHAYGQPENPRARIIASQQGCP